MGRGNFCPCGDAADQWYIDYDFYRLNDDEHDEYETDYDLLDDDVNAAFLMIQNRFPSFSPCDKYMNHYWGQTARLENKYFYIGTADNEWSEAIFIVMKDDLYPEEEPLANRHFDQYCKGIQEILLDVFGTVYLRNGPWMSSKIEKAV